MEPIIRQYDGWQTASASAIRSWLSGEETRTLTECRRNANDLQRELGPAAANALATAIAPTMPLAIASLSLDAGLNFADPHTIATLEALASAYPQFSSVVSTILGWVRQTKTRWAWTYGDMPLPSEDDITLERAKLIGADWRDTVLLPFVNAGINAGKSPQQICDELNQ